MTQNGIACQSKRPHTPEKLPAIDIQVAEKVTKSHAHRKQTRKMLINHTIKVLKKFPVLRTEQEHRSIHKVLKTFPCLTSCLSREELQRISLVSIVETYDRGQIIFGNNGFYLVLKGSVKPYLHESATDKTDQKIGEGEHFGSFEALDTSGSGTNFQYVLTLEPCEILRISHAVYGKFKKEILAQKYAQKVSLIKGCQFYLHWPKLYIDKLANIIQLKSFPANQMLVREGKICPFVCYIGEGECNILKDGGALVRPLEKKGSRMKFVVMGKLGPMESFGEVSVLLNQPSPCSILTTTEVKGGIIEPEALKELDSVTVSLTLQTAQPTCGKLSQEDINKEYTRQERQKEWEYMKKKVLADALFYSGKTSEYAKWTQKRGSKRAANTYKPSFYPST
ncbi:cyclic nucleotide-binding domain-containing protein 1 [Chanos chanos]|uniref:Cyclic nucleotide-binding domain-containing protein 1 n=1 Tax=Chanos chanos TaxID=29144 RepID=A0A6J2UUN9_CHACN|nr:cyclic nucleotide-binding domain-containing protein 1 [Chanos chanos]